MESKKQLLNKATDAYINIFTGTRHQRKKHINENEDIITYIESELRIINVGMVTSSIFMACLMVLIGILFYDFFTFHNLSAFTLPLAIFPTQKLYVMYTDGLVLDFQLTKYMQFQVLKSHKFPNDSCGHFGFYDIDKLFVFVGNERKFGYYLQNSSIKTLDGSKFRTKDELYDYKGFTPDSTHVRVGNHFWLIGGHVSCYYPSDMSSYIINKNSMIWSISKNKWIEGPDYMKGQDIPIKFENTCAIAINKTAVLFIGLQHDAILDQRYEQYIINNTKSKSQVPNDITIIYNFEFHSWALQDFLPINGSVPGNHSISSYVLNDTACGVIYEKVRSRILVISAIKYHDDETENYQKLSWISDLTLPIKWTMLKIIDPIKENNSYKIRSPGKMVALQGVMFFVLFPNSDGIFGYRVSIREDTIQFFQVENEGMMYDCALAQNVLNNTLITTDQCIKPSEFTKLHQLNLIPHY